MKSLLIISRQSPWSGLKAREALDIALSGGTLGISVGMLFLDDGVWQLIADQKPTSIEQKNLTANLQALSLFDINDLYASEYCLNQRAIKPPLVLKNIKILDDENISVLLKKYDQVITI